jgi:hypothetical protein
VLLPVVHGAFVAVNAFHFAGAVGVHVLCVLERYLLQLTTQRNLLPGSGGAGEVALFAKGIIPGIQTGFFIQRMAVGAVFFAIVTFINVFDVCLMRETI